MDKKPFLSNHSRVSYCWSCPEAVPGIDCPLTHLEYRLRYTTPLSEKRASFIGTIIDSLLFYDAPGWLFTIIYTSFAVLVVITFIIAPPTRKGRSFKEWCR
jgi:hypothetical protein